MSRFRRAVHSVASWYILLAAASVHVLATVPLAFRYLSQEQFALWALMSSIGLYLNLIDFGMSGAVSRLLIDHKDQRADGAYGSLIKTGWLVLVTQGTIVFLIGFGLAPMLGHLLKIKAHLQGDFVRLLDWQCATMGLGFALRIFSQMLQAHQRIDILNYSLLASLVVNFGLLWLFFIARQGVFSLAWAGLLSSCSGAGICALACWRLRLYPPRHAWGRASWACFRDLFGYGKDVFLIAVGMQLIMSSQTMIVTRCLGMEAATAWNVGTRAFNMVFQALWRLVDASSAALSEMVVRGEQVLLRQRYQAIVTVTASLGGVAAVAFASCNSAFVQVWMHGQIAWPPLNDLLLAVWMVVVAIGHCHVVFVMVTKKIGFLRYLYFVEGLVFVAAALLTAPWGGLAAIIVCSIVCSTVLSGAYGLGRVSRYFDLPLREAGLHWLAPMGRVLLLFAPAALLLWLLAQLLDGVILNFLAAVLSGAGHELGNRQEVRAIIRLAVGALFTGPFGLYLFLRYGLSPAFQRELLERSPRRINPILQRVFASAARRPAACP